MAYYTITGQVILTVPVTTGCTAGSEAEARAMCDDALGSIDGESVAALVERFGASVSEVKIETVTLV